jgi:hypothetical protein
VASVLGALAGNSPDPDEMAACSRLLKHLADTAGRRPPSAPQEARSPRAYSRSIRSSRIDSLDAAAT